VTPKVGEAPRLAPHGGARPVRQPDPKKLEGRLRPGETPIEANARVVVDGLDVHALVLTDSSMAGPIDITACAAKTKAAARRVADGDLSGLEAILAAQAITLNALFARHTQHSIHAADVDRAEAHMRMALRAQSQCRATVETLGALKNPPVVFARQANIAAGPQQVNNQVNHPAAIGNGAGHAHAEEIAIPPNRLLEAHGRNGMERIAEGTATGGHSPLAAVGAIDGATHARGKGPVRAECVSRRSSRARASAGPRVPAAAGTVRNSA